MELSTNEDVFSFSTNKHGPLKSLVYTEHQINASKIKFRRENKLSITRKSTKCSRIVNTMIKGSKWHRDIFNSRDCPSYLSFWLGLSLQTLQLRTEAKVTQPRYGNNRQAALSFTPWNMQMVPAIPPHRHTMSANA